MKRIAAVIVTYNNPGMLRALLLDILAQERSPDEVIVVDNGSAAGAEKAVSSVMPSARYIRMPENSGSAGGYRAGIELAARDNDFVWTLDDDVSVPPDSLRELLGGFERLEKSCKVAIVRSAGAKTIGDSAPERMDTFTWRGCLIRTDIFAQGCMVDDRFFLYGEELDLSYRLAKRGYLFFRIPSSACREMRTEDKASVRVSGRVTSVYTDNFRLYYAFRNYIIVYVRHGRYFKIPGVFLYALKVCAFYLIKEGPACGERVRAVLKGLFDGFAGRLGASYTEEKKGLLDAYLALRRIMMSVLSPARFKTRLPKTFTGNILVLRHDRIGDMVLSTPMFESLKAAFPDSRLIVLASEKNKAVLYNNPHVDEVIVYRGVLHFIRSLWGRKITLAIDPFYTYGLKTALLSFLSNAVYRIGFEDSGREIFFNLSGPRRSPGAHMTECLEGILKYLGVRCSSGGPKIYLTRQESDYANDYLYRNNFSAGSMKIAVAPGAFYPSQRWPEERFTELISILAEKYRTRILVFAGRGEGEMLQRIMSPLGPSKVEPVYALDFRRFAACIGKCRLVICNNTGTLHVAAALGVPTVSFMGPTYPDLWRPCGAGHVVIRKNVSCSPCSKGICESMYCMRSISVAEVSDAVEEQLQRIANGKNAPPENTAYIRRGGFNKILIVNLGGIGDMLLSMPALKAVRGSFPRSRISLLVVPRVKDAFGNTPFADDVFALEAGRGLKNLAHNARLLMRLRSDDFDIAVNMRSIGSTAGKIKMACLMSAIRPGIKAGRDTDGRGDFFDIKIDETRLGDKHESEYDIGLAAAIGAEAVEREFTFDISSADTLKVRSFLGSSGCLPDDIIIGFDIGGKPSHKWPIDNVRRTITAIWSKNQKCRFVVIGDISDAPLASSVGGYGGPGVINAAGQFTLGELAAFMKMCRLYICNDTGSMHLAAILKTPLIALFGPGYIRRFDPRAISASAVVLRKEVACSPCDRVSCRRPQCLGGIAPSDVADAAVRAIV